jgi:SAM-dependent methyltransferase
MDVRSHNRTAWNKYVDQSDRWTVPVDSETVERARHGDFALLLTPIKPVPMEWFPKLNGSSVLCLASGGGQQAPLLAAAGGVVTVFDNSPKQLQQDRFVAERDALILDAIEGDMADLSVFVDGTFDMIFHPCSNVFVPNVVPVWRECFRVLRSGGILLAGFNNPVRYLFDDERMDNGSLEVRYSLPYSDLKDLSEADRQRRIIDPQEALEFGHTLEDQIGGQLEAGFLLTSLYEDKFGDAEHDPISKYMATFIATRACKP